MTATQQADVHSLGKSQRDAIQSKPPQRNSGNTCSGPYQSFVHQNIALPSTKGYSHDQRTPVPSRESKSWLNAKRSSPVVRSSPLRQSSTVIDSSSSNVSAKSQSLTPTGETPTTLLQTTKLSVDTSDTESESESEDGSEEESDYNSSSTTEPALSPDSDLANLGRVSSTWKIQLIDRVMNEIMLMLGLHDGAVIEVGEGSPKNQSDTSPKAFSYPTGAKRPHSSVTGGNSSADSGVPGDDDADAVVNEAATPPGVEHSPLLFACPFYQRNPNRYNDPRVYRSCCGPGWKNVHRTK